MEGFMSGWNRRPSRATSQWLAHGGYTIMSSSRHLPMLMWKSLQKERRSHEAQSLLQQHRHCQPLATSSHFIQGLLPKDTAIIARWAASRFKVQGVCVCVCVCICAYVCVCICICVHICCVSCQREVNRLLQLNLDHYLCHCNPM